MAKHKAFAKCNIHPYILAVSVWIWTYSSILNCKYLIWLMTRSYQFAWKKGGKKVNHEVLGLFGIFFADELAVENCIWRGKDCVKYGRNLPKKLPKKILLLNLYKRRQFIKVSFGGILKENQHNNVYCLLIYKPNHNVTYILIYLLVLSFFTPFFVLK